MSARPRDSRIDEKVLDQIALEQAALGREPWHIATYDAPDTARADRARALARLVAMGAPAWPEVVNAHGTRLRVPLGRYLAHLKSGDLENLVLTAETLVARLTRLAGRARTESVDRFILEQDIKPPAHEVEPFGYSRPFGQRADDDGAERRVAGAPLKRRRAKPHDGALKPRKGGGKGGRKPSLAVPRRPP